MNKRIRKKLGLSRLSRRERKLRKNYRLMVKQYIEHALQQLDYDTSPREKETQSYLDEVSRTVQRVLYELILPHRKLWAEHDTLTINVPGQVRKCVINVAF